jgi:hypothetical protein
MVQLLYSKDLLHKYRMGNFGSPLVENLILSYR